MKDRFTKRGYPLDILEEAYIGALRKERTSLMTPKKNTQETNRKGRTDMRIIGQFDIQAHKVRKILKKYWNVLLLDNVLRDILPNTPMITYRKGQSIRDRLVKSHFDTPPNHLAHG